MSFARAGRWLEGSLEDFWGNCSSTAPQNSIAGGDLISCWFSSMGLLRSKKPAKKDLRLTIAQAASLSNFPRLQDSDRALETRFLEAIWVSQPCRWPPGVSAAHVAAREAT
jgi:hypothetical protein